jgi:hypothetical protein
MACKGLRGDHARNQQDSRQPARPDGSLNPWLFDGIHVVLEMPCNLVEVVAADSRSSINCIALIFAPDETTNATSFFARSKARERKFVSGSC